LPVTAEEQQVCWQPLFLLLYLISVFLLVEFKMVRIF
jgi:hypothetical protein